VFLVQNYLEFSVKILASLLQRLKNNKAENNDWWKNLKCIACKKDLIQEPYSYCGHCKRTLCRKCGYIPGGCGWCGG
jgi:hypothetical protein